MKKFTEKPHGKVLIGILISVLVLAGALLLPPLIQTAQAAASGDYEYTVNEDGISATITGYTGAGGDITIPDTVTDGTNTYTVTEIGENAFTGKTIITSTMISDGVINIGTSAFSGCSELRAAYFLGNAPAVRDNIFSECSTDFIIYYKSASTGFSDPWNGYATAVFNSDVTYTVTFDLNGAAGTAPDTQTVYEGVKAVCPTEPSTEAKIFGGWYTEAACEHGWDFDASVANNMTLFALWKDFNGAGTEDDPYQVSTPAQLNAVRNYPDAHFIMTNDIDMTEATSEGGAYWNDGKGWQPITTFSGTIDGDGFDIIGLYINRSSDVAALVDQLSKNATIEYLSIVKSRINGTSAAGLVRWNLGYISHCHNSSTVSGYQSTVGGVVAENYGTISECYNIGQISVSGYGYVGGIAGKNSYVIRDCYNSGVIKSSYSHGIGGIVGELMLYSYMDTAVIINCYNAGEFDSYYDDAPGGIAGDSYGGFIIDSYYLENTEYANGQDYNAAYCENVIRLSANEMMMQTSFVTLDFDCTWEINQSGEYKFPVLQLATPPSTGASDDFAGGLGTLDDPYQISTPEQLNAVRNHRLSAFVLINDINLSVCTSNGGNCYYEGKGWEPIGSFAYPFAGDFNGDGHEISGLFINRSYPEEVGLFGVTEGAVIKNIDIEADIHGYARRVGCIVGMASNSTITNCSSAGRVEVKYNEGNIGGIAGYSDGTLELSYNKAYLIALGTDSRIGGIVGYNCRGTVKTSYNNGNVMAASSNHCGGIAGFSYGGATVMDCYNSGFAYGGGIVGQNNSYIYRCYNVGAAKGIVLGTNQDVIDCYYKQPVVSGPDGAVAKTNEELQQATTFENFNFSSAWIMGGSEGYSYPELVGNEHDMAEETKVAFAGGDGTAHDPYRISTVEQLFAVNYYSDKSFVLVNDIDLDSATSSGESYKYDNIGWVPICNYVAFTGSFDGNGFSILNLKMSNSNKTVSFFGIIGDKNTHDGSVMNMKLKDININGWDCAALCDANYGTISNCGSSGIIKGTFCASGLVLSNFYQIDSCYSTVSTISSSHVCGIARYNYSSGIIKRCYFSGFFRDGVSAGGIAVDNYGIIENCFNSGSISGYHYKAGIAVNNKSTIELCYSNAYLGTDDSSVGAIVYENQRIIKDCYYISSYSNAVYRNSYSYVVTNVVPKSLAELKQGETYAVFDFTDTWEIEANVRTPVLRGLDYTNMTDISLSQTSMAVDIDSTANISVLFSPCDATNKNVIWQSDNESVVTVTQLGEIKAHACGIAYISATTQDGGLTKTCKVTVEQPVTGINLEKDKTVVNIGESEALNYTISPSDATARDVIWQSDNVSVVKVDGNGVVTGVSYGKATITVNTMDGFFVDTCVVTVSQYDVPITGIALNYSNIFIDDDGSYALTATISPSNADNQAILWSSGNEAVVTVDANGVVSGVSFGTTTVTATTEDGGYSAICNVNVVERDVTSVNIGVSTSYRWPGEFDIFTATVYPATASNKAIVWSSSDTSIATVGASTGMVQAMSPGTAIITATTVDGGFIDTATILVKQHVTGIELTPESIGISTGQQYKSLSVSVLPSTAFTKTVSFASSNNAVARVNSNGYITGVSGGTATITVTSSDGNYTDTCEVTVKQPVTNVYITPTVELDIGDTYSLSATVLPANATYPEVTWSSDDEAVVSIDQTGKMTAEGFGSATITATADGKADTCTVTVVQPVLSISLKDTTETIFVGNAKTLSATVSPSDATYPAITWSSSDTNVATVDQTGKVIAVVPGTATITATADGMSDSCEIQVVKREVTGVTISSHAETIVTGASRTVSATVSPSDATYPAVIWSSSNTSIATVDQNGRVTAVAPGTAAITATADGVSDTCAITVQSATHSINAAANNAGYGSVTGGGTYNRSASVTLYATANAGYHFVRWTEGGSGVSTSVEYSFTVTGNRTLVAVFEQNAQPPAVIPLGITCTKTDAALYGAADGSITITASGGNNGSYEYSINGGSSWQGSNVFVGLAADTYTAVVRDAGNTGNTAACGVIVEQPAFAGSVAAKKVPSKANAGTAISVIPPAAPRGYTTTGITYSSSNPFVAAVDANGNVTFLAGGKATIITKIVSQMTDGKGRVRTRTTIVRKTITVKQPIGSISLNYADVTIARTQKLKLTVSIAPSTASDKKLIWKSGNPKIASVSSAGVVTGKTGGTVVITCTAKDGSGATASCTVTVTPIYPAGLKMSKAALTVKPGKTASLRAIISPSNTDFKALDWQSSNPEVATVNVKGKVRGVAPGTAVITATTSNGIVVSCTVTVK